MSHSFQSFRTVFKCELRIEPTSNSQQYFHFSELCWSYEKISITWVQFGFRNKPRSSSQSFAPSFFLQLLLVKLKERKQVRKRCTSATDLTTHQVLLFLISAWLRSEWFKMKKMKLGVICNLFPSDHGHTTRARRPPEFVTQHRWGHPTSRSLPGVVYFEDDQDRRSD